MKSQKLIKKLQTRLHRLSFELSTHTHVAVSSPSTPSQPAAASLVERTFLLLKNYRTLNPSGNVLNARSIYSNMKTLF